MRIFNNPQKVNLTESQLQRAKKFAEDTMSNYKDNYKDTNQTIIEKIRQDFFVNKLGEEAVSLLFNSLGHEVYNITETKGPNYTIYPTGFWGNDLIINGEKLAVKTQSTSQAKIFSLSWTFQLSPRKDPILENPNYWVIFVECDIKHRYANVYLPYQIKELKFTNPLKSQLRGKKLVVLASDLPCNDDKTKQSSIDEIWEIK